MGQSRKTKRKAEPEVPTTDPRKISVYFPETLVHEVDEQALRLERSRSWVLQKVWKLGRDEIRKLSV